jgi:hypothetical protein
MDGEAGSAPGAIQSMTTLASTTGTAAHPFQPALPFLDHEVGR